MPYRAGEEFEYPRGCRCGSKLRPYPLLDARGIFVAYVCGVCESTVRKKYRQDIFTDPDYWIDEQLEDDE
jgi:hypothetical protein